MKWLDPELVSMSLYLVSFIVYSVCFPCPQGSYIILVLEAC